MPRPEKEIVPFYKVKGILTHEDAHELRRESIIALDELKSKSEKKRIVRINSFTWIEVSNNISDEEAVERFFCKVKKLKEIH